MNTIQADLKRRIRTVLYQDQRFTEAELDLLHTPSMQRLYDLRQLGFADRVFVDASHTRLAHVMGVMEIAMRLVEAICRNLDRDEKRRGLLKWGRGESTNCGDVCSLLKRRLPAIRLMGFLHDLTHAPFGHTLEDEIKLVAVSHDVPARQADAFLKLLIEYLVWTAVENLDPKVYASISRAIDFNSVLAGTHTVFDCDNQTLVQLGGLLLQSDSRRVRKSRLPAADLAKLLINYNFATRALYHLEISHKFEDPKTNLFPAKEYRVNALIREILTASSNAEAREWTRTVNLAPNEPSELEFCPPRDAYCLDIIGDTICADLLDYASRDALQSGLPLAFDLNRIVENFTIVSHVEAKVDDLSVHPFRGPCLRAAVDFSRGKFRGDVVGELIELLQVRYYVYERVLFHPTKCVAGAMLGRAVQLLGYREIPAAWQKLGDAVFLQQVRDVIAVALAAIETARATSGASGSERFRGRLLEATVLAVPSAPVAVFQQTRELFRQRDVRLADLKASYASDSCAGALVTRLMHWWHRRGHASVQASLALGEALKGVEFRDDASLNDEIFSRLTVRIAEIGSRYDPVLNINDAKAFLTCLVPTIDQVKDDLIAAQKLIARLGARRLAKRVFCLMPANIQTDQIPINSSRVANRFLNPRLRGAAERAIEEKAGLPNGSVVIHCPPGEGPRKVAKVLVTYVPPLGDASSDSAKSDPASAPNLDVEERRRTIQLRHIDRIGGPAGPIFGAHAKLVTSLEEMYASMWRLWVAVAPPDDQRFSELSQTISRTVSTMVLGAQTGIPNDAFMVEELQEVYAGVYEPVPIAAVAKTTPGALPDRTAAISSDIMITAEELRGILTPYVETFSRRRQKVVWRHIDVQIPRLLEAAKAPAIRQSLRAARVGVILTAPRWEARDITAFAATISRLTQGRLRDFSPESETAYRNFSDKEKRAIAALERRVLQQILTVSASTPSAGTRLAALASSRGIRVTFQPLLCPGLYGAGDDGDVILINSVNYDQRELNQRFASGEQDANGRPMLLPPDIRFTLAHELVHHFIATSEDPALVAGRDEDRMTDIGEHICDRIACRLLIRDSAVDEFMADQPLTARKMLDASTCLGVEPLWLIRRLGEVERFTTEGQGYAVFLAKRNGKDLVTVRCALSATMRAKMPVLDAKFGDRLPIDEAELQMDGGSGVHVELEPSVASVRSDALKVRVSATACPPDSPEPHRVIVAELM